MTEILNNIDPKMHPWGTPLITGLLLDISPSTAMLWVQPYSQPLSTKWSTHQSHVFPF